jgi:peptide chain release factor 2
MRRRQDLDQQIGMVLRIERSIAENIELIALGELEGDQAIIADAEAVLQAMRPEVAKQELQTLLSGEADSNDCYVEIHAGAGGTESQDWASMLLRMYVRWAEAHRYKVEFIEEHAGEEAGIKSATILVKGNSAYGWLKTESGVHRLVRISPYDANARRHTSFASIWVFPVVDDNIDVAVNEGDCRIDTYRASGAGGQHVNTTDSAVRITHLPTGIVVSCQNERSQLQNKASAMMVLQAKLLERRRQEEQARMDALKDTGSSWGNQMRSYVLHPYQMVKDLRTEFEVGNPSAVLDGEIDGFIEAGIRWRRSQHATAGS